MSKLVKNLKARVLGFVNAEEGVTAIEYALIAGLIAVAIIAAVALIGNDLNTVFGKISAALGTVK